MPCIKRQISALFCNQNLILSGRYPAIDLGLVDPDDNGLISLFPGKDTGILLQLKNPDPCGKSESPGKVHGR